MGKVDVVMPVYQVHTHLSYFQESLNSLVQQTFKDFEVMMVVDGNDLETADYISQHLPDDRFNMTVLDET